ncbi:MAG: CHAT domain-containing protein [Gammaproteobacteria bacterium]
MNPDLFKLLVFAVLGASLGAQAQVETDGSLGAATSLAGPAFAIPQSLGQTQGNNLFHSFRQLDLSAGQSATFSGAASLQRVIARVTGGAASSIDGTLRSTISGADLYLLNPQGVVFGPNASLDVSGAFIASSADSLEFADGSQFSAGTTGVQLSQAAPSAFGFDGPGGAIKVNNAALAVASGQRLALVGGPVTITGPGTGAPVDNLVAPGGELHLVATGSAGRLELDNPADSSAFTAMETLRFEQAAYASGNGTAGGRLELVAGTVEIVGGTLIESATFGALDGAGIAVRASERILIDESSALGTQSLAPGAAGPVSLSAADIQISDASNVFSFAFTDGDGGAITLAATEGISVSGGASGKSQVFSVSIGAGDAGDVSVNAPDVTIEDAFLRSSQASPVGTGDGGALSVTAERLTIRNGGGLDSSTQGAGLGGAIQVNASESVSISGFDAANFAGGISSSSGSFASGNAGAIVLNTGALNVSNGSIQAATTNALGGAISLNANQIDISDGGNVLSSSFGAGAGGDVSISALSGMTIQGAGSAGARTGVFSQARGGGDGGAIGLEVGGLLRLSDAARVDVSATGTGDAGATEILASRLEMSDAIITAAAAQSSGGEIRVQVDTLALDAAELSTTVTGGTSNGGNLSISSRALAALNGSQLTAQADQGFGGDITLSAEVFLRDPTVLISASSNVLGNDGNIRINAPERDVNERLNPEEPRLVNPPRVPVACAAGMLGQGALGAVGHMIDVRSPMAAEGPWPTQTDEPRMMAAMSHWWTGDDVAAIKAFAEWEAETDSPGAALLARINRLVLQAGSDPEAAAETARRLMPELGSAGHLGGAAVLALARQLRSENKVNWPMRAMFNAASSALRASESGSPSHALALAALAVLYEKAGRLTEAASLYTKAAKDSPSTWAATWWSRAAGLMQRSGDDAGALAALDQAAESLWQQRGVLARLWRGRGSTYRAHYAEVFQRQVSLRLSAGMLAEATLRRAQRDWERLKTAELAEYHGDCVLAAAGDLPATLDAGTVVLYPMLFEDHLKLLVQRTNTLELRRVDLSRQEISMKVNALRTALEGAGGHGAEGPGAEDLARIQALGAELHAALLAPVAHHLAAAERLVLVPDGPLRLLPPALLHDGERYLIERLAVASVPGLSLVEPEASATQGRILLAGATAEANVQGELSRVAGLLEAYPVTLLSGGDYRLSRLRTALAGGGFDVLHFASHAYFDAQRGSGLLIAAGEEQALDADTLRELIAMAGEGRQGLELLALSACETALGDERAALGLGGLAVRTGARSALATLWEVDGAAAFTFMESFYRQWRVNGLDRAEAARKAVLKMLKHPYYEHPSYWAGFQLIGDWRG